LDAINELLEELDGIQQQARCQASLRLHKAHVSLQICDQALEHVHSNEARAQRCARRLSPHPSSLR
jgi:hypothetical protein